MAKKFGAKQTRRKPRSMRHPRTQTVTKLPYGFIPDTPSILYEILLPARHKRKLRQVLDGFLDKDRLRESPPVKELLDSYGANPIAESILNQFMEVVQGYSMYEVDGRFVGKKGVEDEKTIIVRVIVPNPENRNKDEPGIYKLSRNVISFFVTKRFAEELGIEDEVWFFEQPSCVLNRWVKTSTNALP
jgi:hypothetical protein